ncbi:glycine zipper 2TM domain-containing protein [Caenibius sp. WL]|uniref:glycine zipper 2TM domain-containing protein n=1 Tax=Caenibius sp. WL TaxID=2872646 RepID=UPI0021BDC33A|nr:glycine zipper 2TM domain-containing protein [Caenibius sp. WL]
MPNRHLSALCTAGTLILACGMSAGLAQAQPVLPYLPVTEPASADSAAAPGYYDQARYAEERQRWLAECRRRYSDNGVGGGVIGGLAGGVAGNRFAGKGNRTVGTLAGAAIGAAAGVAIDKGEDRSRTRDMCEDYLTRHEAAYTTPQPPMQGNAYPYYYPVPGGYPAYGYGPAAQPAPPLLMPYGEAPAAQGPGGYYGPVILVPKWVPVPPRRANITDHDQAAADGKPAR